MSKPLVWVPRSMSFLIEGAPAELDVVETPDLPGESSRLGDVEMIVVETDAGLEALFPKMSSLKVIQTLSAGIDWVVSSVPEEVILCSARGVFNLPLSEWVVAAILSDYKSLSLYRDQQRAHQWQRLTTKRLAGSTVLILGYGAIAEELEARLQGFGVNFVRVARNPRPGVRTLEALPELLPIADIVVVLVPLTPTTQRLVDRDFLAQMKAGALLVNAARGRIVDTDALVDALAADRITAVLDVTDPEPLPVDHPLFSLSNVLITPHNAGGGKIGAMPSMTALIGDQITRFARGQVMLNVARDGY